MNSASKMFNRRIRSNMRIKRLKDPYNSIDLKRKCGYQQADEG